MIAARQIGTGLDASAFLVNALLCHKPVPALSWEGLPLVTDLPVMIKANPLIRRLGAPG